MLKLATYITLILSLLSCRGYRTLEGRVKPVLFSAAPDVFRDTLYPVLSVSYPIFEDLKGGIVEVTEIRSDESSKAFIKEPTLFYFKYNSFLAYPNEQVMISGSVENPVFTTVNGNKRRNKELMFFKTFESILQIPAFPNLIAPPLDTVLKLEQTLRVKTTAADIASEKLFDSLAQAEGVSRKFKKLARAYVANRYDLYLPSFYSLYRDTLKVHNLYFEKLRALIPAFNAIDSRHRFNHNVKYNLNEVVQELFPGNKMWSMGDEEGFKRCFDSVAQNFTGLARDYLLSRIMYRANLLGLSETPEYWRQYRRYNSNNAYGKIVRNARKERRRSEKDKSVMPNQLVAAGDNRQNNLEAVLEQHKGKLVFIDLWASWCLPCLKEIPYLNGLVQKYPKEQIVFISISSDKQTVSWREAIAKHGLQTKYNYMMLNAIKTAFYKKYEINNIPRYMLIGRDGKMINADAPVPSDAALTVLLDKILLAQ